MLMLYEFGGFNLKDQFAPVWERGGKAGFALGSLGAFLVIEGRDYAEKRGAKPLARLTAVRLRPLAATSRASVTEALDRLWDKLKQRLRPGQCRDSLRRDGRRPGDRRGTGLSRSATADLAVRATGTYLGHGMEPQFAMNVALAAIALGHGSLFPPHDPTGLERPMNGDLQQVLVTGVGHWRGEGLALVERVA